LLARRGYVVHVANAAVVDGRACPVTVGFPYPVFGDKSVIAVPDIHLGDGSDGDVFLAGEPDHAQRLADVLATIDDYLTAEPDTAYLVQLGDWYDVWRAIGEDTSDSRYAAIDNVALYQTILELDKRLGMAHAIGNHDASFAHALPDRRVADGARYRFGFGLLESNGRIFTMHGHQADAIEGAPNLPGDQRAVWIATLVAKYVTAQARNLENFLDQEGTNITAVRDWLMSLVGLNRGDPVPTPRTRKQAPLGFAGSFVERESCAELVKVAVDACAKRYPAPEPLEVLLVGHSHKPCVAYAPHPVSKKPVIVVDAGSWVQGAAQILFAAGDRISVFDIVRQ
jgi:hypothetical protein